MIIDIVVIVVLLISAIIAFLRGFIREVLTIAGVVGGLAAAYAGGPLLIPHMQGWMGVEDGIEPERLFGIIPYDILANVLSYGCIFLGVVIILSIISHFIAEAAKSMGLGAIDRTFGFIFGLVRGVLLLGLLYLPFHMLLDQETKDKWFEGSQTHFYLEKTSASMGQLIPSDTAEKVEEKLESTSSTIDEANTTRKKLEEINLLQSPKNTKQYDQNELEDGYNNEFRDKMNQLFEDETNQLNE